MNHATTTAKKNTHTQKTFTSCASFAILAIDVGTFVLFFVCFVRASTLACRSSFWNAIIRLETLSHYSLMS